MGRVLQHDAHLLGDVHEQVVEYLEHDRVAFLADLLAQLARRCPAEHEVAPRVDLGAPVGLDHGRCVGLDDDRRTRDGRARTERRALVHRGFGPRVGHPDPRPGGGSGRGRARGEFSFGRFGRHADGFDLDRLDDDRLVVDDETEMPLVRAPESGERLLDRRAGFPCDRQRGVGTANLEQQPGFDFDPLGRHALSGDLRLRVLAECRPELRDLAEAGGIEHGFDCVLPDRTQIGDAHAVGREHPGERVDQHRVDAERIGDLTGMLAGRSAEARQREARHVVTALYGNLLDRVRHAFHGNAQEARSQRFRSDAFAALTADALGKRREFPGRTCSVDRFVSVRSEGGREEPGLDPAEKHVRVRYGQRPAVAVTGGSRERTGRLWPHLRPPGAELEDRAAAGRDRVNAHHGRGNAHSGDDRRGRALEALVEERDVRRGPAHVEADDARVSRRGCRTRHADDASGGPGEHAVLAPKLPRLDQAAVTLHEEQRCIAATLCEPVCERIDVAPEHRCEVGVDERGVAARHDLHERADPMGYRDLAEADALGDLGDPLFMPRKRVAVQQHDRDAVESCFSRGLEVGGYAVCVERRNDLAVGREALLRFDDPRVEHLRQADVEREDFRPLLRADPDRVAQTRGGDENRRLALPLEQRVRPHRRAHPDRERRIPRGGRRPVEVVLDAGECRVTVAGRVVGQQLERIERTVRSDRDDVGERTAAIDQKLPGWVLRRHELPQGIGMPGAHRTGIAATRGAVPPVSRRLSACNPSRAPSARSAEPSRSDRIPS